MMFMADTVESPLMYLMHRAVQLTAILEQQLMQIDPHEMHVLKLITRFIVILDRPCICLQQASISS